MWLHRHVGMRVGDSSRRSELGEKTFCNTEALSVIVIIRSSSSSSSSSGRSSSTKSGSCSS